MSPRILLALLCLAAACSDRDPPRKIPTNTNTTTCNGAALDNGEVCDGTFLGGATCNSRGFAGGTLRCNALCSDFDTSLCTNPSCGDNNAEGAEVCDGTDLNSATCQTRGFTGGTLRCRSNCSGFDTSLCTSATCGDGTRNGTEP